jgi:hypothetical protein
MLSVPVFVPLPVGLNRTEMEQLNPGAMPLGADTQVLVCEKLELLMLILETCKRTLPLFVTVTVCAELVVPVFCVGKVRLIGDSSTIVPVPVSETVCGLPVASSVIFSEPLLVPAAVGVNFTNIGQLLEAASELPQELVCEKLPEVAMLEMLSAALPVLRSVTNCEPLVVFTRRAANESDDGDTETVADPEDV